MKQKARYRSKDDITRAIDKYRRKAQQLRDSAAALDAVADQFVRLGSNPSLVAFNREQAGKKRIAAGRIEERTLSKLKEKLAEFQTAIMPGIITDGDTSIPVSTRKPRGRA